jgi:hypothetical protein
VTVPTSDDSPIVDPANDPGFVHVASFLGSFAGMRSSPRDGTLTIDFSANDSEKWPALLISDHPGTPLIVTVHRPLTRRERVAAGLPDTRAPKFTGWATAATPHDADFALDDDDDT